MGTGLGEDHTMTSIHRAATRVAFATAALSLAGCIETGVGQKVAPGSQTPGIEVTPLQLSFGAASSRASPGAPAQR